MKTWINNNSSREILKSRVLQSSAKSNRVESLFTTAHHTFDRTRKVTILAKYKVMQTERSACREEHDGKARNHFVPSAFSLQIILKYCFCISRNTLASKFKALEKNETIGCMMHCYKIEFNFLQKKFSKHLLRNISCECLYCEIKCIKSYVTRKI